MRAEAHSEQDDRRAVRGESLRTCAATGRQQRKDAMVRFVIDPDGRPVPDLEEKLPGRGIWLSAERDVIDTACAKNLFARRARRQVDIDAEMPCHLERLLARRCIRWLELARRAGQAVGGFDEVRRALRGDGPGNSPGADQGVLLAARDGGADGRDKIARLAQGTVIADALDGAELGTAFGRERVAHAFVQPGGLGESLRRDMARLHGVREQKIETAT